MKYKVMIMKKELVDSLIVEARDEAEARAGASNLAEKYTQGSSTVTILVERIDDDDAWIIHRVRGALPTLSAFKINKYKKQFEQTAHNSINDQQFAQGLIAFIKEDIADENNDSHR